MDVVSFLVDSFIKHKPIFFCRVLQTKKSSKNLMEKNVTNRFAKINCMKMKSLIFFLAQTHPLYLLTKQGLLRGDRHEGIDRSYMNLFVVLLQRGVKVHIWNFCGICEETCCYAKLWHVYFKKNFRINFTYSLGIKTMYFIWIIDPPHFWLGWYLLQNTRYIFS